MNPGQNQANLVRLVIVLINIKMVPISCFRQDSALSFAVKGVNDFLIDKNMTVMEL
jgi:hypothetical protein